MQMYLLSCEKPEKGGGIYRYEICEGEMRIQAYLPCDRPMYAVKACGRLHVLLRAPFANSGNSGYFSCSEDFSDKSDIRDTLGRVACHLCVADNDVYIVNYLSGNLVKNCVHAVAHTGRGRDPERQEAPHTHCVIVSPDKKYVLCTDLGTDTLYVYDRDLRFVDQARVPDGYGIRHIVFSRDGRYLYAVNELLPSVAIFRWEQGRVRFCGIHPFPSASGTGAAIRLSADGKFLYCSQRGENVLYVYEVCGGQLRLVQQAGSCGVCPRDFHLDRDKFLICCNEKSDNVCAFLMQYGRIGPEIAERHIPSPLCCVV